ncbi:MAG TPA: phosphatase [Bacteroidales bacterium]|nr:phosphatase [Bacteroidales bacterium]
MRLAIIDLGTNTFNLLIVDVDVNKQYKIIFNDKAGVKLGKGGINNKIITPEAFLRALNGIAKHMESIQKFNAEKIIATATSGIRSTENGKELVTQIKKQFGIDVKIISGDEEAELIYRGVKQTVDFTEENALILDIGGGSNEFILVNKNGLLWKQSFDLGISRLLDRFNPSNPITRCEITEVEKYIDSQLNPLYEAVKKYKPTTLIGSSGTFDSIREMIIEQKGIKQENLINKNSYRINLFDYLSLHAELLKSTYNKRLSMKGLEFVRIEMIVLASIFVNFIIQKIGIKSLIQSSYALKEGLVDKIING